MAVKLNQFATRFLKSVLALSVVFLLLAMGLCLTPLSYLVSAEYILVFSLVALLLSGCILIPIKFIKVFLKIILSIGALVLAPFYLTIKIETNSVMQNTLVRDSMIRLALHMLSWLITISTACKEGTEDMRAPVEAHARNLQFFKNFSRFIGLIFVVGVIVLFFVNYTLIQNSLIHILWVFALYFIVELLLIRVSRDAIYVGLKALNKRSFLAGYVIFGVSAATSAILLLVFKKKLDRLFVKLIGAIRNFCLYVAKLWRNFINYFKRIFAAIQGKPIREESSFFDPSVLPEDVLEDFGMGDITLPGGGSDGGIGGNGGGGTGGIGGVGGGSGGGIGSIGGGSGGLGLAGTVGNKLSESGELGLGDNIESTQGNAAAMAFVRTEKDAVLYLKLKSFGDYNGKGWEEAVEYNTRNLLYDTYGMNYLSGTAILRLGGMEAIGVEIVSLTGQYFLPDYMAIGDYSYEAQTSDVQMIGDTEEIYRLQFYNYQDSSVKLTVPTEFSDLEIQYRHFVYDQYLQLPETTYNAALNFLQVNGITPYSSNRVQRVFRLLGNYTYNLQYDQTLDQQEDVVLSFLLDYQEGICQHFASAGVVMFRALGIPARYVGGLYAGNVEGGEWTVVVANAAHAWVEIYQDGVGWVRVDPTSFAQVKGETLQNTFDKDEYNNIIKENEEGIGGGSDDGFGDGSGEESSEDSEDRSDEESSEELEDSFDKESSEKSEESTDKESSEKSEDSSDEESSGGFGDDSEDGSGDGVGDDSEDGSGDGVGDDSEDGSGDGFGDDSEDHFESDENGGVGDSSEEEKTDSSSSQVEEESSQEIQISDSNGCNKTPLKTAGIVAAALVGCTLIVVLILYLCKKKKPKILKKIKVNKKKLTVEEALAIAEAEDLAATQIIRNNYKAFIKLAGKNGIRQYPIDTTQSLRNKYNTEIGPNEAMEILTNLYRIARYNKDERLTVEDANQSTYCLEVIKKAFAKKKKEMNK